MTTLPFRDASDTCWPSRDCSENAGAGPESVCAAQARDATSVVITRTENARNMGLPPQFENLEEERDAYMRLEVVGRLLLSE